MAAFVVFLRGVNVGGSKTLKSAALAKDLSGMDVRSVGAAGTFVVRGGASAAKVRAAFADALPFETDVLVRPAREIGKLEAPPGPPEAKALVTVLASAPRKRPKLPMDWPAEDKWQLRLVAIQGAYAFTLRRAEEPGKFYPNEILEKTLGVRGTTRGWSTIEAVRKLTRAETARTR